MSAVRPVRTAGRADVLGPAAVGAHAVIPGQIAIPVPPRQLALPRPPYPGDATWRGRTIHTITTGGLA